MDDGKLAHATRLGADLVFNAKHGDPAAALKKATGGGARGVDHRALPAGLQTGRGHDPQTRDLRPGGPPAGRVSPALFSVVADCITVRGSFVGTRKDMAECLAFAADGRVKADIELQPLSAINDVFERLEHGDVPSRVVLDFAQATAQAPALAREMETT